MMERLYIFSYFVKGFIKNMFFRNFETFLFWCFFVASFIATNPEDEILYFLMSLYFLAIGVVIGDIKDHIDKKLGDKQ